MPAKLNLQEPLPELPVEDELQETEEEARNGEQFHSAASTIEATDTVEVESAFEFPVISGAQSAMADAIRELQKNFGEKASQPTKFTRTNTGSSYKLKAKVNNTASPGPPGKKNCSTY